MEACSISNHKSGRVVYYSIGTHLHHIIPKKYGGDDSQSNLIRVCRSCHHKLNSKYEEEALKKIFSIDKNFFRDMVNSLVNK